MASEEEKTTSEVKTKETVFKFGDSDLSDVIFVVEENEFHCHKMVLAAKSEYFKAMFFSEFIEKDQRSVTVHGADPVPFMRLMEIIYNGYIKNAEEIMVGDYFETLGITYQEYNNSLWEMATSLFALADRFLLTDIVRESFQMTLIHYDRYCPYDKTRCSQCAVKLLLALCFEMEEYKKINTSARYTVTVVLGHLSGNIEMPVGAMQYLMERD